ncbi:hypothetical protein OH77DRAFT_74021 [Trametes cingulata]|nr:hypothetical protein OH77DRAFT_74021 [Trametes cingulata]
MLRRPGECGSACARKGAEAGQNGASMRGLGFCVQYRYTPASQACARSSLEPRTSGASSESRTSGHGGWLDRCGSTRARGQDATRPRACPGGRLSAYGTSENAYVVDSLGRCAQDSSFADASRVYGFATTLQLCYGRDALTSRPPLRRDGFVGQCDWDATLGVRCARRGTNERGRE